MEKVYRYTPTECPVKVKNILGNTDMYANYIQKCIISKTRENASFFVINNYKLGPILAIFWQKTKDIVIVKRLPVTCVSKTYCLFNWILELFRNYDFFREQNGLIGIGSVVLP